VHPILKSDIDKGAKVETMLSGINGRRSSGVARLCRIGMVLGGAFALASCHSNVTQGRGASYLVIDQLLASAPSKIGQAGTFENILRSDVITNNTIFEDLGQVSMHIDLRDVTNPTGPTSNNNITINHYRVEFRRTDGRNQQGVDVPYAFEGGITFTVTPSGSTADFALVRPQAKLEAPLIQLRNGGGALLISTLADVTFYGKDQTGTDATVTGTISVNFADWGDPPQ
jgi:hypothetical protein